MVNSRLSRKDKAFVKARARYCCEYCWSQEDYSPDTFSIEHIIPLAKGGTNILENLANACQGCNNRKYTHTEAIDPLTGKLVSLYNPRLQKWPEHFVWDESYTELLGITPNGRATVARLDLNRPAVVNLRNLLREKGLHPRNN